uniref:Si:ch73-379j16.2 n=1 Tax=Takifugu rubripes TaxID=31033 RepID=A0A674NKI8_TAKRU
STHYREGDFSCTLLVILMLELIRFEPTRIVIKILDVNDNPPEIEVTSLSNTVPEGSKPGTVISLIKETREGTAVGNVAKDLGMDRTSLADRGLRVVSGSKEAFFDVDADTGALKVRKKIDREETCPGRSACLIELKILVENPLEIHYVVVEITDINDHSPSFPETEQRFQIAEQTSSGTRFEIHAARDPDSGVNSIQIEYSLSKTLVRNVYDIFELDRLNGKIRLKGLLNYEESETYRLDIEATDKGTPPLTSRCRVTVKVKDVNDNPPEIEVTSLSNTVPEDSKPGTVISLISVSDKDSGVNGKIISRITSDVPFELKPSYKENTYSIVTKAFLDREMTSHYEIIIQAVDCGEPPLSTVRSIQVQVSDINDNSPRFIQNPLQFYLVENNVAGASIFSVSATDNDVSENAVISYSIARLNDVTSFLNVNSENGQISALKSFDFETLKTFQFQVVASDSGSPSLSSNVTVKVFILDQNDNAPVILYPVSSNGSAEGVEEIPRNVNAGHLVTKVRAYDADIGYNGWLLFSLQQVSDHSLFGLDRYTGQIRTLRSFTETDEAEHKLVILVKDNGNVSLSATATVMVKLVEPKEAFAASDLQSSAKDDEDSHVTFYLMITLGSVSVLFIISIIVLIAMQCSKSPDYTSKYLPETNYDGTLCHSIQYRSGDKRYMLVGPRMSIGSTIARIMSVLNSCCRCCVNLYKHSYLLGQSGAVSLSLQHFEP